MDASEAVGVGRGVTGVEFEESVAVAGERVDSEVEQVVSKRKTSAWRCGANLDS